MPMASGQAGRIFENLVENAYTAQSGGRLASWLPVLDSRGVDRAVEVAGGPPLYLQVKEHEHSRRDGRLSFAIPLSGVGAYERWHVAFVAGAPERLEDCYLVSGPELRAKGEPGRLTDGRPCLRVTLSPGSELWAPHRVPPDRLGEALLALAQPGLSLAPPQAERQQEEGARYEAQVTSLLLAATDQLSLYRPAVDFEGRDLLLQAAGRPDHLYLQIKGTDRLDVPGHPRFQVRRRTFARDPRLVYVFLHGREAAWAVPAPELADRAAGGDEEHISFEPRVEGDDPRWGRFRCGQGGLAASLLAGLRGRSAGPGGG